MNQSLLSVPSDDFIYNFYKKKYDKINLKDLLIYKSNQNSIILITEYQPVKLICHGLYALVSFIKSILDKTQN